jgi:hypothetical protein
LTEGAFHDLTPLFVFFKIFTTTSAMSVIKIEIHSAGSIFFFFVLILSPLLKWLELTLSSYTKNISKKYLTNDQL